MPKIGLKGMYVAKYNVLNGVVSYTGGRKVSKLNEMSSSADGGGDANNYYADNGICASDSGSTNTGTVEYTTCGFRQEDFNFLLGVEEEEITIGEETVKELVYDDRSKPDYVGIGQIIQKGDGTTAKHRAIVFTKVKLNTPDESGKTKEDKIDWQPEEISGRYEPDDTKHHRWKRESTFSTEAAAEEYIEHCLNIISIGELSVSSAAGTEVGETKLTVTPAIVSGNSYKYIVMPAVGLPDYDDVLGGEYTSWDGSSDISAQNGHEILVVEVDAENKAKKAGKAVVVSNV